MKATANSIGRRRARPLSMAGPCTSIPLIVFSMPTPFRRFPASVMAFPYIRSLPLHGYTCIYKWPSTPGFYSISTKINNTDPQATRSTATPQEESFPLPSGTHAEISSPTPLGSIVSPIHRMAQERPGVTEMHVRMDCNGCVNRIKKALHTVEGIYEVQVNFPEQKLTVIGRAAPEKMLRAIKKTRKIATICSHTEPGAPEQAPPAAEPAPAASGGDVPPADAADQPPAEAPPAEAPAAAPPAQEPPAPQGDAAGEVKTSPQAADDAAAAAAAAATQPEDPPAEAKDVGEIHMIHDHHRPHRHVYQDQWGDHHYSHGGGGGSQYEAPYLSTVIHSYSRHRQATHVSEYGYLQPPPQSVRYAAVVEPYSEVDYYRSSGRGGEGNNITSMFSDENPNACTIV